MMDSGVAILLAGRAGGKKNYTMITSAYVRIQKLAFARFRHGNLSLNSAVMMFEHKSLVDNVDSRLIAQGVGSQSSQLRND